MKTTFCTLLSGGEGGWSLTVVGDHFLMPQNWSTHISTQKWETPAHTGIVESATFWMRGSKMKTPQILNGSQPGLCAFHFSLNILIKYQDIFFKGHSATRTSVLCVFQPQITPFALNLWILYRFLLIFPDLPQFFPHITRFCFFKRFEPFWTLLGHLDPFSSHIYFICTPILPNFTRFHHNVFRYYPNFDLFYENMITKHVGAYKTLVLTINRNKLAWSYTKNRHRIVLWYTIALCGNWWHFRSAIGKVVKLTAKYG